MPPSFASYGPWGNYLSTGDSVFPSKNRDDDNNDDDGDNDEVNNTFTVRWLAAHQKPMLPLL